MAQVAQASRQGDGAAGGSQSALPALVAADGKSEKDKVLPLPGWLVKLYFVFPVVLYVPDIIFNYVVYSTGVQPTNNMVLYVASVVLWSFLSVGVVGMAYLLSVLAPWHWGQGHRIQAFFCGIGVVIATAITTWNSLAFRSRDFVKFPTDDWVYSIWPQLHNQGVSITMILVAIAPPFWGLFWAIVQPTETGRSLRQLQESHEERLMRMQQEAEVKRLKAETNAKVREAQLRGMAATASAARQQAAAFLSQKQDGENGEQGGAAGGVVVEAVPATSESSSEAPNVLQLPTLAPTNTRELAGSRGANFFNHAAAAAPGVHSAPAASAQPVAQPALMADVQGFGGMPGSDSVRFTSSRRPPTLGGLNTDVAEFDGMTGTTGPRPAVRRSNELGSLARGMTGPSPRITQAIEEAFNELNATGKRVTEREHVALSAQKLGVDESAARSAVRSWRESKRAPRA